MSRFSKMINLVSVAAGLSLLMMSLGVERPYALASSEASEEPARADLASTFAGDRWSSRDYAVVPAVIRSFCDPMAPQLLESQRVGRVTPPTTKSPNGNYTISYEIAPNPDRRDTDTGGDYWLGMGSIPDAILVSRITDNEGKCVLTQQHKFYRAFHDEDHLDIDSFTPYLINCQMFSPDEDMIALYSYDLYLSNKVLVYGLPDGELLRTIECPPENEPYLYSFLPAGDLIVVRSKAIYRMDPRGLKPDEKLLDQREVRGIRGFWVGEDGDSLLVLEATTVRNRNKITKSGQLYDRLATFTNIQARALESMQSWRNNQI